MVNTESMVDLRSDTITCPTPEMRRAMANAAVGDDVFGEDPSVNELQQRVAVMFGKEASLFVPSGTMANQLAIRAHTEPGDEIICEADSHVYRYEGGGPAALSGCSVALVEGDRGIFNVDQMEAAIRADNVHYPRTKLVTIENTSNRGGGSVWPVQLVAEMGVAAKQSQLALHMDGARIMNACTATGVEPSDYARHVDSCTICFSKGLGAPVGSAVVGSFEFIDRVKRFRKMFGGGMRQAGILAAGAIHALDHHVERLVHDHANALRLAEGITKIPGLYIDPDTVESNIVIFELDKRLQPAEGFVRALADAGVLMLATSADKVRAVTSLAVDTDGIERTLDVFKKAWQ